MSKKHQQIKERLLILENCDRGTVLEVTKSLLTIVSEVEQYLKEENDPVFFFKNTKQVRDREDRIKTLLLGLHNMFND